MRIFLNQKDLSDIVLILEKIPNKRELYFKVLEQYCKSKILDLKLNKRKKIKKILSKMKFSDKFLGVNKTHLAPNISLFDKY